MDPLLQVQEALWHKLLSESWFSDINVQYLRKLVIESQVNYGLLTVTARGGKMGAGIIVEMPTIAPKSPGARDTGLIIRPSLLIAENPTINLATGGTGKTAEEIGLRLMQTLSPFYIENLGEFYLPSDAFKMVEDVPEELAGHVVYRATLQIGSAVPALDKCTMPSAAHEDPLLTLTPANVADTIYYTLDESFPGSGNDQASEYAEPIGVETGDIVTFAAYRDGLLGSDVGWVKIT